MQGHKIGVNQSEISSRLRQMTEGARQSFSLKHSEGLTRKIDNTSLCPDLSQSWPMFASWGKNTTQTNQEYLGCSVPSVNRVGFVSSLRPSSQHNCAHFLLLASLESRSLSCNKSPNTVANNNTLAQVLSPLTQSIPSTGFKSSSTVPPEKWMDFMHTAKCANFQPDQSE